MKTTLLFPPQWTAAQPYYGLATLNGQLRRAGHQVQLRDLNLEFMDELPKSQVGKILKREIRDIYGS